MLLRQLWEEGLRVWGHGCPSRCILATHGHCSHQLKAWECYSFLQGQARITWVHFAHTASHEDHF